MTPFEAGYGKHVYHLYPIRVPERDELMRRLEKQGIGCGIHYPIPVHLQKAYQELGYTRGAFPISEQTSAEFISLPMFPELSGAQVELVIDAVKESLAAGVPL